VGAGRRQRLGLIAIVVDASAAPGAEAFEQPRARQRDLGAGSQDRVNKLPLPPRRSVSLLGEAALVMYFAISETASLGERT
jgi:hypothetical protein